MAKNWLVHILYIYCKCSVDRYLIDNVKQFRDHALILQTKETFIYLILFRQITNF